MIVKVVVPSAPNVKVIVPESLYARVYFARGEQGVQGIQGIQGIQGATGAKGDTGATGAKGDTGATGATGAQGIQGIQGIQGETGATGAQGIQGIQGIQGVQGEAGDKYHTTSTTSLTLAANGTITLYTADLHLDYSQAQTVIIAHDLDHHMHGEVASYNQSTGALTVHLTHKSGSGTFNSWEINLDGAVGIAGATGAQGEQGIQGIQGEQGIQGIQGVQGEQGITGTNGTNGTNGLDGLGLQAINYVAGNYYTTPWTTRASGSLVFQSTNLIPFIAAKNQTFTKLSLYVNTINANATFTLGLYNSNSNGFPSTRIDQGYVSGDVVGVRTVTGLNMALTKGNLYWIACNANGITNLSGLTVVVTSANALFGAVQQTNSISSQLASQGYYATAQTTLPSTWTSTNTFTSAPLVWLSY